MYFTPTACSSGRIGVILRTTDSGRLCIALYGNTIHHSGISFERVLHSYAYGMPVLPASGSSLGAIPVEDL